MAKDTKYIRKRKRKYGSAYLVDIPYVDENGVQKHYTATVKIPEYPNKKPSFQTTYPCIRRISGHDGRKGSRHARTFGYKPFNLPADSSAESDAFGVCNRSATTIPMTIV